MMNKFTAGIVDDEKNNREYISLILEQNFPEIEVLFKVSSIGELQKELKTGAPDILFLDIQLNNGLIFADNYIHHIASLKIFITAYQEYALEAIKSGVFDYLLKPINHSEFQITVHKAIAAITQKNKQENAVSHQAQENETIDIPTSSGYKRVRLNEIVWCEADSSYTKIHLKDKPYLLVSKPLASFDEILSKKSFFRIHNKYLINLDHYEEYIKGKGGQVVLSDGSVLDISVRKRAEFLQYLQRL